MPDPAIIPQVPAKPLVRSKEELADELVHLAARLESNIPVRVFDPELFRRFHEVFLDLIPRTSHTDDMQKARVGKRNLLKAIEYYFNNKPEKHIKEGTRLANAYHKAMLATGMVSTEGR